MINMKLRPNSCFLFISDLSVCFILTIIIIFFNSRTVTVALLKSPVFWDALKMHEGSCQIFMGAILFSKCCRWKIWLHLFQKARCKGEDTFSCNSNLVQLICFVYSIRHTVINQWDSGSCIFLFISLLCSFSCIWFLMVFMQQILIYLGYMYLETEVRVPIK